MPSAPAAFLQGALDNPDFSCREAVLLLRNCRATPEMLDRIASNRRLSTDRAVAKVLLRHPKVSSAIVGRLLPRATWKDLAEVCAFPHTQAAVRARAESILRQQLPDMALGERMALARIASRGVLPALFESDDPSVLTALLGNPFLQEGDAIRLATDQPSPDLLTALFEHPRWSGMEAVLAALAANPHTPKCVALGALSGLEPESLQRLSKDDRVPTIVRVAAGRAPSTRSDNEKTPVQRPRADSRGPRS